MEHYDDHDDKAITSMISSSVLITPLKFNMEPENGSLEKEIPFGNHHFQVLC